jgi:hypothetical protein
MGKQFKSFLCLDISLIWSVVSNVNEVNGNISKFRLSAGFYP